MLFSKYHLKEHTSTEPHKVQLGRPPSSGTSNVFPPQKKSETPHRVLGPESDKGSNDEREEGILFSFIVIMKLLYFKLVE